VILGALAEPDSHKDTNWMFKHRTALNQTCAGCHDTKNAGQATNDSFCSNAACHGVDWKFAGLNAPGLLARLAPAATAVPKPTPQPTLEAQVTPAAEATSAAPATPAAGGAVTYASVIGTLFTDKCGACHGDTATAGLKLTDYASAMKGGQDGVVIVPGKSADSLLVKKQSGSSPHFGQLSPDELAQVKAWIDAGAPEK
jgi:mono/diheme cytochrome c family protein